MSNVKVLDCTLRDGGRIINCAFPDNEIRDIAAGLADAKIDIIETGFLRDHRNVHWNGNSTFFTDTDQISPYLDKSKKALYVAFIDYGLFDFDSLKPHDGTSIDGIRFGFTKKNLAEHREDVIRCIHIIKDKGYKLFIQGVNSLNYTDKEILELTELVNEVHPYSFGIVDTYGAMYIDDVDRLYTLIDHNLDPDICINFHSHNNYQLSFGFAQEVIKLSRGVRNIIIDSTLNGMGKVAGNLNTELIINYLVRKLHYDYNLDDIIDLADEYIAKYRAEHQWGYSIPAMMAGIYKSHPNNIIYLTEKYQLSAYDIGKVLSMIDPEKRMRYDYDNTDRILKEYMDEKVDDHAVIEKIRSLLEGKDVLVLCPGPSLYQHKKEIDQYIHEKKPLMISVNFISDYEGAFAFFSSQKRFNQSRHIRHNRRLILSSNVKTEEPAWKVNFLGLVKPCKKYFDDATIMLLNLLRRCDASAISLAGFDGYDRDVHYVYVNSTIKDKPDSQDIEERNAAIGTMFREFADMFTNGGGKISFVTASRFEAYLQGEKR